MNARILLAITAFVTTVALASGHPLLHFLSYVLWGILLLGFAIARTSLYRLEISRQTLSKRAEVGGICEERFQISNRFWLPKLWLEVLDESNLPGHRASRALSNLRQDSPHTWTARTLCTRRGVFRLGPTRIAGGDPLGIFHRERRFEATQDFVVFPKTYPIREIDLPSGYLSGGRVIRRRAEQSTSNVRGVRAYRPGDAISRVHWPTTARRGELHTKEFEIDPIADYWLLVDLEAKAHVSSSEASVGDSGNDAQEGAAGRPNSQAMEDPEAEQDASSSALPWMAQTETDLEASTEEYAISAAASIARHLLQESKSVGLISYAQRRLVLRPDRGERQIEKILGNLAVLRASGRTGLSEILSSETHEFKRRTTLILVTPTANRRWVEGLRELKARGVRCMVVNVEANSFGSAASPEGLHRILESEHIPYRSIRHGDDIGLALEMRG